LDYDRERDEEKVTKKENGVMCRKGCNLHGKG